MADRIDSGPSAAFRSDIARFKSDLKRALVLQAVVIVGSIVALLKLLP